MFLIQKKNIEQSTQQQDIRVQSSFHATSCLLRQKTTENDEGFISILLTNTSTNIPETVTCIKRL